MGTLAGYVEAPFDGQEFTFAKTPRPKTSLNWSSHGGVVQVVHEWDTVNTFDSGNLVSDTNSAIANATTTDEGVPPSDLGGVGTSWYYRATITDTATNAVQSFFLDNATGGTFTLSFDGQGPTGNINWNDDGSGIKTQLELLSNITTVSVTGSGTEADPWIITFSNPQDAVLVTADVTNVTGTLVRALISEVTHGSAGQTLVLPPAGYQLLNFVDAADTNHPRFLHANHSIGVGFETDGADGNPINKDRFLYLNQSVTSDQPCPFVANIAPTLASQSSSVLITGSAFGATAGTYSSEVRLYEDQDMSGSYVVMSTTSWSDTAIAVTVPASGTTGWIVVVHTNVAASCDGSEPKLLTVTQVEPDSDAGWWLKTANRLNITDAEHTVLPGNNVKTSFRKIMNAIGSGQVELPLGDPIINDFIDPVTRKGVLVQTYIDARMRYGWYAENMSHDYNEEGDAVVTISGRGMEVVSLWNKLLPHDYPASPTKNPTWIYGSTDNFIQNPGFDEAEDDPILQNPGGEDGNDDDGKAEGWGTRGDDLEEFFAVNDPEAGEGDWYIYVDASDNHSGITQSVSVTPNKEYWVRCWVKDPLASGMRVTLALGGADDIAATATYANNFEFGKEILAELDNVASNGLGTPGGATDGSWQVMDVEVKTGKEQTSLTITIQNDHHSTGVFNPFWVDNVLIEGWGLGLDPWVPYQSDSHASNSFRLQNDRTFDASSYGLYLNPLQAYAGIQQVITLNPNTKYTLSCWGFTNGVTAGDSWDLVARKNDGLDTLVAKVSVVPVAGEWTQFQVIFDTSDLLFFEPTQETIIRFAYTGSNNPDPMYVDSFSLVPGEPPSSAGLILNEVLDKMNEHGKLTYLTRTFTDDLDSAGQVWPSSLSMDLDPSESLYGLLSRLVALGHEWEIVPAGFLVGGNTGFELNVFTARPYSPDSGIGTNWINDAEGPVIMPGDAAIGGRILKSAFNANTVMAIGDDGVWSRVTQYPWLDDDMPAGDPADHGYRDAFGSIEEVLSVSAGDTETIAQFAQARLAEEKDKERAIQLLMQRSSVIRPFLHFNVGDSLFVDMPPTDPDPPVADGAGGFTRSYPRRIRSLQADLAGEGSEITFQVDIDRVIYEDELAWYAKIAQLSERAPGDTTGTGTGTVGGSGGAVSVVVGGGTTTTPSPHTHDLKSAEIKNKALTGDVSGSLPGPVTVNALKGMALSPTIPADTGGQVYWVYDRDYKQWVPTELSVDPPLTTKGDLFGYGTADARIPVGANDSVLIADSAEDLGVRWAAGLDVKEQAFSQPGVLNSGDGTGRLYTKTDRTIIDVCIMVGVASTSGVVTVDMDIDGTTAFTTSANRPELAVSAFVSDAEVPDVTAWDAGSYISFNVDAAGTSTEYLVVVVRYKEA